MKLPFLISLSAAAVLLGLICWAEYASWREVLELQGRLDSVELRQLLAASDQWPEGQREVLRGIVEDSRDSVGEFRGWLLASCVAVLVLGALAAHTVKREMINPLQESLVETHAVIARQEKMASLGVLAAGVAHEIRNPLTAIKARLFTQKKKLEAGGPAMADAEFIHAEINRLEQIVKDFLLFTRPSDPKLEELNVDHFLEDVHELMAAEVEGHEAQLKLESDGELQAQFDPAMMKQVLINLIRNAAESLNGDGVITLRTRSSFLPFAAKRSPAVAIDVEDNGAGIPPEVQQRLFDPFFTTKASGTGLGLAIAERIVDRHGGTLEYRTAPQRGTTFTITLPALKHDVVPCETVAH
jgi:signal transduction histidine kinase